MAKIYSNNSRRRSDEMTTERINPRIEAIIDQAKQVIPNPKTLFEMAVLKVPQEKLRPEYIRLNFSEMIVLLEREAYGTYLEYESKVISPTIDAWISDNEAILEKIYRESNVQEFSRRICSDFWPVAKRLEFRLGQMRKSRAGHAFEMIMEKLLNDIGCRCQRPFKEGKKVLKRIDLVIPSQETALRRPDQAYFLSCKRTLRERWKQTIPERKPTWRVFIVTVDDELPEDKAREIDQLGIIAYVRDELKAQDHLRNKDWVRQLTDLPRDLGLT